MTATWAIGFVTLVVLGRRSLPRWRERRRLRRHGEAVESALPEVIDLVAVVLGAGGTIGQAIALLAEEGPLAVRDDFRLILDDAGAGRPLGRRLVIAGERFPPSFRPVLAALVAAERDGAPIGALVLRLGDEARLRRRSRRERRARTLAVEVLFPLVCCSLPAVVVGAIVPLALVTLGSIRL